MGRAEKYILWSMISLPRSGGLFELPVQRDQFRVQFAREPEIGCVVDRDPAFVGEMKHGRMVAGRRFDMKAGEQAEGGQDRRARVGMNPDFLPGDAGDLERQQNRRAKLGVF